MPDRVPRHGLETLCRACADGDLDLLETLLDREDPVDGFLGDINEHHSCYNALHYAAINGQLECVEALLGAGADPHVRARVPYGRSAAEGKTAAELADDQGWEDCVAVLRDAEAQVEKGDYVVGGPFNNAKIYPSTLTSTGRFPEEAKRIARRLRGMRRPYFREEHEMDPSVGVLFPGQGSHYVGMLSQVLEAPYVAPMLQAARCILGWDAAEVCVEGPASRLESVEFLHPAMYIAGLVALERLKREKPDVGTRPGAVAGFGVGEFAALAAAGVLSFEDGLRLVRARAEAVKEAAATGPPQALLSVAGVPRARLAGLCEQLRAEAGQGTICAVAYEFFDKGATCGGPLELMERLEALVKEEGAVQAKLFPGGAFHTQLMAPAVPAFKAALGEVAPRLQPPRCDVYLNGTGRPLFAGTSPRRLLPLLLRQITEPIRWEECMRTMIQAGVQDFYEIGPMRQLKAIMKRINPEISERMTSVEV